jgi:hypothetical protein
MSGIQVPGQARRGEPNPLLVLAAGVDKTNQHLTNIELSLRELSRNTAKEERHIYALAERPDGSWGTYCLACSEMESAYVYPCKRGGDDPVPPSHITVITPVTGVNHNYKS